MSGAPRSAAINGYGRIGRCVLRALYAGGHRSALAVLAVNDLAQPESMAYLTGRDTAHGRFPASVSYAGGDRMMVGGDPVRLLSEPAPERMPWRELGVDLVFECSGSCTDLAGLRRHLDAGAGKALLSSPGAPEVPVCVVGLNEELLGADVDLVSAGSCTSNAILPVIDVLDRVFGVEAGSITTLHAAMNDQPWTDRHHSALRLARAAGQSMIPVPTGLAQGIERVLPRLAGRFCSSAMRVPILNVSAIDLTVQLARPLTAAAANAALVEACAQRLGGVIGCTEEPLVSCDFGGDPRSGIVDLAETRVSGHLLRVLVWFDNEWAFSNRMVEIALRWLSAARSAAAPQ